MKKNIRVETKFPEDNKYGKLDSSEMMMLHGGFLRILNPIIGRGFNDTLPIFQIDVLYCPYCGKKLKNETVLTKYNNKTITSM